MCQVLAVGICAAGADEDSFYGGGVAQVVCEGVLHGGLCVFEELERVRLYADLDEVLDLLEGVRGLDVHAFDGGVGVGVWIAGCETLLVECAEVQDQEDEAVFAAIVGDGELWESGGAVSAKLRRWGVFGRHGTERDGARVLVLVQGIGDDVEGYARLGLQAAQPVGVVVLVEEGLDAGVDAAAEGREG